MTTKSRYRWLREQGRCVRCGKPNDQRLYVRCTHCYTPKARHSMFAGVRANTPEYQQAYAWHQLQQQRAPVEIACCGSLQAVLTDPLRMSCCGRVLALPQEPTHA